MGATILRSHSVILDILKHIRTEKTRKNHAKNNENPNIKKSGIQKKLKKK